MLEESIQNLYRVFSAYKLNRKIYGCYCNVCLSENYNQYLHQKKLTELNDEDFIAYLSSCEILSDDQNDFKHFVPRMLELYARPVNPETYLYDKNFQTYFYDIFCYRLGESLYTKWKVDEVDAVNNFFKELWYHRVKTKNADIIIDLLYDLADAQYPVEFCLKHLSSLKPEVLTELLVQLYDSNHLKELNKYDFNPVNEYRVKIKDWFLTSKNIDLLNDYFKSGKDSYGRTSLIINF